MKYQHNKEIGNTLKDKTTMKYQQPTKFHTKYKQSIRIGTVVSSISIDIKLLSLWLIIQLFQESNSMDLASIFANSIKLKAFISDFIYKNLKDFKGSTGKGLSDHVALCLIVDILSITNLSHNIDKKDFIEFLDGIQVLLDSKASKAKKAGKK